MHAHMPTSHHATITIGVEFRLNLKSVCVRERKDMCTAVTVY
jgi:hypothetical protein